MSIYVIAVGHLTAAKRAPLKTTRGGMKPFRTDIFVKNHFQIHENVTKIQTLFCAIVNIFEILPQNMLVSTPFTKRLSNYPNVTCGWMARMILCFYSQFPVCLCLKMYS